MLLGLESAASLGQGAEASSVQASAPESARLSARPSAWRSGACSGAARLQALPAGRCRTRRGGGAGGDRRNSRRRGRAFAGGAGSAHRLFADSFPARVQARDRPVARSLPARLAAGTGGRGAGGKHNNKEVQEVKFKINSRFSGAPESRENTRGKQERREELTSDKLQVKKRRTEL